MQEMTEEEGAGQLEPSMTMDEKEVVQEQEMLPLRLEIDEESSDTAQVFKLKKVKRKTRKKWSSQAHNQT